MEARFATASMSDNLKKTGKSRDVLEIAVGMKAMVLLNPAVEADIGNGTRGTIEKFILDDRKGAGS